MLSLVLLIVAVAAAGDNHPTLKRKIACKTSVNADSCFWTHGRLSFYNGTPAFRLWKIGTHRLLGIYSGPGAEESDVLDNEHPELPANVQAKLKSLGTSIYADFEVCPLEPERVGEMQAACIESASHLVVEDSSKQHR